MIASFAFFSYSHLTLDAGALDFLRPQLVQGAGMPLVFVPLTTIAMDPIPLRSMGYATSIFSLIRNIGSSVGISFVTTELARRSHRRACPESNAHQVRYGARRATSTAASQRAVRWVRSRSHNPSQLQT